jgi:hypothetical protein
LCWEYVRQLYCAAKIKRLAPGSSAGSLPTIAFAERDVTGFSARKSFAQPRAWGADSNHRPGRGGVQSRRRSALRATSQTQKPGFKVLLSGAVLLFAMSLNYQAAFVDYPAAYRQNAWNASEMAKVIKQTEKNTGFLQNAWVVGYPYWVDARAVALEADRADQVLALMPTSWSKQQMFPAPSCSWSILWMPARSKSSSIVSNGNFRDVRVVHPGKRFSCISGRAVTLCCIPTKWNPKHQENSAALIGRH